MNKLKEIKIEVTTTDGNSLSQILDSNQLKIMLEKHGVNMLNECVNTLLIELEIKTMDSPSISDEVIENGGVFNKNRLDVFSNTLSFKNINRDDINLIIKDLDNYKEFKIVFTPIFRINDGNVKVVEDDITQEQILNHNGDIYLYSAKIINDKILYSGVLVDNKINN